MNKPMTDFVMRGGLGELLAAATQAIEEAIVLREALLAATPWLTHGDCSRWAPDAIFQKVKAALVDKDGEPRDSEHRLQLAVNDGIKAREDEAKAGANPMTPRAVCHCGQLYFVKLVGPRSVGYCSDACLPAEVV